MDQLDRIIAYENGELSHDDMAEFFQELVVEFFQELVNSGLAWKLQGHYGRMATALIEAGLVVRS